MRVDRSALALWAQRLTLFRHASMVALGTSLDKLWPMSMGRQLDGPGRFTSPAHGTNAGADFGSAMLMGIDVPTAGCWQITATYRKASLSYVAWVSG